MKNKTRQSKKNRFLTVLSDTLKNHEKTIGREISYRMKSFKEKEIADLQGRVGECKTYIQDIVEAQLKPVATSEGRKKLKRFEEDPQYILKYVMGSIPNYCRKKRREWKKLYRRAFKSESDNRAEDEWLTTKANTDSANHEWDSDNNWNGNYDSKWDSNDGLGVNSSGEWDFGDTYDECEEREPVENNNTSVFKHSSVAEAEAVAEKFKEKRQEQRKLLNKLMKQKGISPLKRKCLRDRLSGMSFPEMANKYESKDKAWDKKGNKYRKRFYRAAAELGLSKNAIDKYVKEFKQLDKIAQDMKHKVIS